MKKIISLFTFISIFCLNLSAEDSSKDKDRESKRILKEEQIKKKWEKLMPKQNKLQFAGSMGMFSASIGWYYGKKDQWETDLFFGFIPKMGNQDGHFTLTLKETYTPWKIKLNDRFSYEPLTTGLYINKIFGEYFWNKLPEKYPEGYYFWAVNTRFNIFAGQAITYKLVNTSLKGRELSFYYELSTNDLYVISAIGNKSISALDIIGLSLGIRYRLF